MFNTFVLYGQDIDSYAFRTYPSLRETQRLHQGLVPDLSGEPRPEVRRCKECGEMLSKWEEPLVGLVVKKRQYDIGTTFDGIMVVSSQFKSVCEDNELTGLVFRQLPSDPSYFAISATDVVAFDAARRKTRFLKPCCHCGHFQSIVGATPVYLKSGSYIENRGFTRTDLEFGSGDEKHPLLICGGVAAEVLSRANLKGIDLEPVANGAE
jgi:hypothetical protein